MHFLHPFRQTDWYQWAGAQRFGTNEPLIYDADPRFVVIVGGGDDGGMPEVFVHISKDESKAYAGEITDDDEFCTICMDPSQSWDEAVLLGDWLSAQLTADSMPVWVLVRSICKCQRN